MGHTRLEMIHAITTLQDNTRGLVADDAVALEDQSSNSPRLPEMEIGATNPGGLDV